jgi:aryl-alcohol dehydrogenase-like predicted oxidoreductase
MSVGRAARMPSRYDPTIPGNARKLEIIAKLQDVADRAGISLTHLAVAFTIAHPGVTSAIIGPRTIPHLEDLLKGADVELSDAILDEIDAIVPPGTNVNIEETGWNPPVLTDATLRRRPLAERAAS